MKTKIYGQFVDYTKSKKDDYQKINKTQFQYKFLSFILKKRNVSQLIMKLRKFITYFKILKENMFKVLTAGY